MIAQQHTGHPFAQRPAGHFALLDATNDAYHRECDGVSNSMLSVFLDDPALFEGYYLSHKWDREGSDAMEFGQVTHHILLEALVDDAIGKSVIEIPRESLTKDGKRAGNAWKKFAEENAGKWLLKSDQVELLREIRRNCEEHPVASLLLCEHEGKAEFSIEWTDDATGLLLRSRIDRLTLNSEGCASLIVDVKTCQRNDDKSFAESCVRFGYARQARFYQRGVHRMTGEWLPFVFVAIRKTPPYSVECYQMDDGFLSHGEQEISRALADLAARRDSGNWRSKTIDQVQTLSLPRWAAFSSDWS